jgi:hypothetical protein
MPGLNPFDLLIIVLAAFRLAWFITRESGPYDIAANLRKATTLGGLLDCWKCASFWTAALMLFLWYLPAPAGDVTRAVVLVFAVSGGAIVIAYYSGANHD